MVLWGLVPIDFQIQTFLALAFLVPDPGVREPDVKHSFHFAKESFLFLESLPTCGTLHLEWSPNPIQIKFQPSLLALMCLIF